LRLRGVDNGADAIIYALARAAIFKSPLFTMVSKINPLILGASRQPTSWPTARREILKDNGREEKEKPPDRKDQGVVLGVLSGIN
jgi:hypothetical protein